MLINGRYGNVDNNFIENENYIIMPPIDLFLKNTKNVVEHKDLNTFLIYNRECTFK